MKGLPGRGIFSPTQKLFVLDVALSFGNWLGWDGQPAGRAVNNHRTHLEPRMFVSITGYSGRNSVDEKEIPHSPEKLYRNPTGSILYINTCSPLAEGKGSTAAAEAAAEAAVEAAAVATVWWQRMPLLLPLSIYIHTHLR